MTNFDEQVNGHTPSKLLQMSEMVPTTQPNPPTLEKVKSLVPSEAGASTYNERPASFGPLWKEVTIVLLCCCGPITQTLPATGLLVGLAVVARDFGMSQGETAWISTAISLSSGSFLLLGGRLADLYGRKLILVISFAISAIGSILAGVAQSKYLFFVARGLQGLAAAGAIPAALGILGANYGPGRRKNKVFAAFSAGNPVGAAFGLVLGGVLTSYVSWRWMMYIFGIWQVIVAVSSFIFIPKDVKRVGSKERIDWAGAFLVCSGLILFCFGLTDAEAAPDQWKTWWIIFCLILGLILLGVFIFVESRVSSPLMPLSIWRVPQFGKLMLCFGLGFGAFGGSIIFGWSLYFQQIYGASPIVTTLYFIPQFLSGLLTNIVASFILHIVPGNILLAIALSCYAISCILGALQPLNLTYWAMSFPAMIIGVIGADLSYLVASLFALTSVSESQQSIASGIVATTGAVWGSIYNAVCAALISNIGGNAIEETNPNKEQLIKGFQAQFWFSFASAILGALLALTLKIGRRGTRDEIREDQMTRKAQEEKDAAELRTAQQPVEDIYTTPDTTENTTL